MQTVNPSTSTIIQNYEPHSIGEVDKRIHLVHEALPTWAHTSFEDRAQCIRQLRENVLAEKERLARLMAVEMGKPLAQGISEIEKCAWACEYYADHAEGFLADELLETKATKSLIAFEPLGIVFGIMPWNFPFWQVFRFAVPSIMAGNGVLLKHAPNVTGCALEIEKLFRSCGLPDGLFEVLVIEIDRVPHVIQHPYISAVTLTGSTGAGSAVAELSGKALKKTVLELGGSDPFVVLKDADLDKATDIAIKARLMNAGQSCIAAKRFILVPEIRESFVELLLQKLDQVVVGDPLTSDCTVGPLARSDLRQALHAQVEASVAMGARCLVGGQLPVGDGWFYPVTVLDRVNKDTPAFAEEMFGPVFALIDARSEQHAIELANDTQYGLGASVWTEDTERGLSVARCIQAGSVFVNSMTMSSVNLPFGGIKRSGYGRELSYLGIREFVNIKTLCVGSPA